ncbi:protein kinase [Prevotella cerevisiae]|uniref:non-specific serine/threonine protein kinase n=1 Tax=Segatella cerevisiae TaxID=2053716 RepID=A0ABT1BWB5_9BACT|nr:serine/threonine-protein kinase [Segatella cerevisiae]MCO6025374.1 protein kinase [Segatella cerevisiae]
MDKDDKEPVDSQKENQKGESQINYTDYTEIPSSGIYRFIKCHQGDQWVVLKGLKEPYRDKVQEQHLLKKEFLTANHLDHPHIEKYIDFIDHPEYGKCIVLEYIDGRSLKDYIAENHTSAEKKDIVEQIADALDYIHGKNIVHRNLKPSNILITKDNQVKLIDFRVSYADNLSEPSSSLRYAAPEQRDGTIAVDGRTDIYSLGMIMKDLGMYSEYPDVIDRCCRFGRSERYLDIETFLKDLNHEGSEGGSKKKGVLVVGIILIVIILVAVILFSKNGSPSSEKDSTSTEAVKDTTDTVPESRTAAPEPQQTQAPDTTGQAAASDLDPAINAKFTEGLDKIFRVYFAQKQNGNLDQIQMRKDIRSYYKSFIRTQDVPAEDRQAFDAAFANYVKQKTTLLNQ